MDIPEFVSVQEARGRGTSLKVLRRHGERHLYGIYGPLRQSGSARDGHRSLLRAATHQLLPPVGESPGPRDVRAGEAGAAGTTVDVASHDSAAYLWGFPGVRPPEQLQLLSTAGDRWRRTEGMAGHRGLVLPEEVTVVDGIPVTTPARTWLDLARTASELRLVLWADWLFNPVWGGAWDREALSTPVELRRILELHRGKPGIRLARAAAERARVGSDSAQETRLRLALVNAGLPEPAVNQPILHPVSGEFIHRGDLTYDELRIDLEYEGEHHSEPAQVQRDIARSERLQAADWLEVKFSALHARNHWRPAIDKTRQALLSRGWYPGMKLAVSG